VSSKSTSRFLSIELHPISNVQYWLALSASLMTSDISASGTAPAHSLLRYTPGHAAALSGPPPPYPAAYSPVVPDSATEDIPPSGTYPASSPALQTGAVHQR